MSRRWRVVLNDLALAWSPALVLGWPALFSADVGVPFRAAISLPLAVAACIVVATIRYLIDREAVPAWLRERTAPTVAAIAALGAVALLGFYVRPGATTIGVLAVVVGQAVGTTLYRLLFGVFRPLPGDKPAN